MKSTKIKNSCGGRGCYIKNRILPTDRMLEPIYSGMYEAGNDPTKVLFVFSAVMGSKLAKETT